MKINKHIEIVRCGISKLSSMGLKSCNMLQSELSKTYSRVEISNVSNEADLDRLIAKKPDLAFLGFKQLMSDDKEALWICEKLDEQGISYTGSSKEAMLMDHNKDIAKDKIIESGLLTASFFMASPSQFKNSDDLPIKFPLFIKPPKEGGGTGIDDKSIVRDFRSFEDKVKQIDSVFGTPALVESYLDGREFSVAILETLGEEETLVMPIELIAEANAFGDKLLSRKVKSEDTEHAIIVSDLVLREKITKLALSCYKALGARDYGRIDIRMDHKGDLHFLEANLIPGVANHDFISYFNSACILNEEIHYSEMINMIVSLGIARSFSLDDDDILLEEPMSVLQPVYL
ncbi:MAG: D-alanine--D-alanine ligase [Candidatus Saccharibacteria bacterium]